MEGERGGRERRERVWRDEKGEGGEKESVRMIQYKTLFTLSTESATRSCDLCTECSAPLSMAVKFGHNHRSHVHFILECSRLSLTRLTNSGIHYIDNIVWLLMGEGEEREEEGRGEEKEKEGRREKEEEEEGRRERRRGEEGRREEKMEEERCNYERYCSLVQNKFHGVSESEALARIEVEEMYPNTKNKDKGKQKLEGMCLFSMICANK